MSIQNMRRTMEVVILLSVAVLVGGSVAGASGYSISATPEIDVPSRTAEFGGTEYTIDSITRTTADSGLSVSTDVPSNTSYFIQLRNPDNQIDSRQLKYGDANYDISNFGSGEAGSYAVVIERNGIKAVHPVVIPGYTLSVTVPQEVEQGKAIPVTATVTERDVDKHSELDYVEVVAGDSGTTVRQTLSKSGDSEYTANLSTSDFEAGTYDLSVVVRGEAKVRGRNEIVGIADPQPINITEPATPTATSTATPDDGDSTSGTGGSGGGTTGDVINSDSTETPTEKGTSTATVTVENNSTQAVTATATERATNQQTATQMGSTRSPAAGTSQTESPTRSSTPPVTTSDAVLEPATTGTTTTDGTGPGFTVGLSALAGLLALYLGVVRGASQD